MNNTCRERERRTEDEPSFTSNYIQLVSKVEEIQLSMYLENNAKQMTLTNPQSILESEAARLFLSICSFAPALNVLRKCVNFKVVKQNYFCFCEII
jgi:hypothetical protein